MQRWQQHVFDQSVHLKSLIVTNAYDQSTRDLKLNHKLKDAAVPGTSRLMKTTNKITIWCCSHSLTIPRNLRIILYTL